MENRTHIIRQLLSDSHYVIDEAAVAEAIVVRANARVTLPGLPVAAPRIGSSAHSLVRSFHRQRGGRSFRLTGASLG